MNNAHEQLINYLKSLQNDQSFFEGRLSDSAVSTSTAIVALHKKNQKRHAALILNAKRWLIQTQLSEGGWGDSPESPANETATILAFAALHCDTTQADQIALDLAKKYLTTQMGGISPAHIRNFILKKYGSDLTFSVPILALLTACHLLNDCKNPWSKIPQLPFELSLLPHSFLRFFKLHVVSYAIPALICIGIAQILLRPQNIFTKIRLLFIPSALRVLIQKQPESGGFLEAAPLTSFCLICLCDAGFSSHHVAQNAEKFLIENINTTFAYPIDTNLWQWTTSLASRALAPHLNEVEKTKLSILIASQQYKKSHPFTQTPAGGWAWTPFSGGVPDADDTAAALIALHDLGFTCAETYTLGCKWLLQLQNHDGGIPTFCRGWGKLPFDKSCPDLSAHAYRAFEVSTPFLNTLMQCKVKKAQNKILKYLEKIQTSEGAFIPLWFGNQYNKEKLAPIYGTSVVLDHCRNNDSPFIQKAISYLKSTQKNDGSWENQFLFTVKAVSSLSLFSQNEVEISRACMYIKKHSENIADLPLEPIGLYFAQLWYSEKAYAPIFLTQMYNHLHDHY